MKLFPMVTALGLDFIISFPETVRRSSRLLPPRMQQDTFAKGCGYECGYERHPHSGYDYGINVLVTRMRFRP
jgi:hypothetical protein